MSCQDKEGKERKPGHGKRVGSVGWKKTLAKNAFVQAQIRMEDTKLGFHILKIQLHTGEKGGLNAGVRRMRLSDECPDWKEAFDIVRKSFSCRQSRLALFGHHSQFHNIAKVTDLETQTASDLYVFTYSEKGYSELMRVIDSLRADEEETADVD